MAIFQYWWLIVSWIDFQAIEVLKSWFDTPHCGEALFTNWLVVISVTATGNSSYKFG